MDRILVMGSGLTAWLIGVAAFIWAVAGGISDGGDTRFVWMIGVLVAVLGGSLFQLGRRLPSA